MRPTGAGGPGSNQYQSKAGAGSATTRSESAEVAAAVTEDDVESIAWAFRAGKNCPRFAIPKGYDVYPHLAEPGQSVWQGEEPRNMGMFTGQGDLAVAALSDAIVDGVREGRIEPTSQAVSAAVEEGRDLIEESGHGEVFDTEVRGALFADVEKRLADLGYTVRIEV